MTVELQQDQGFSHAVEELNRRHTLVEAGLCDTMKEHVLPHSLHRMGTQVLRTRQGRGRALHRNGRR